GRTEFFHGARPPGERRRTAASRRNHLGIKLTSRRQVRHCVSRRPAGTISWTAPVALRPATKGLRHTGRLVPPNRDVRELLTDIESHTVSPSLYTNTASSTSKTVGCCTGVHKACMVCSTNFWRQAYSSAWGFSGAQRDDENARRARCGWRRP